jgi:hypothetical protein
MILEQEALEQLVEKEPKEASLFPDRKSYRIVNGQLWGGHELSDRASGDFIFHTEQNAVVENQRWSRCLLALEETNQVIDVEIVERTPSGWYHLQRRG